jgi:NAD(P)-dependent dehydrogenase (short-subunit alcohol dehydrogenase family)
MTPTQRIALITGANRGIGFEICRGLARQGVHTLLTGRDARKAGTAAEKLAAEGLDVRPHQLDVTDPQSVERLRAFVVAEYGRLDVLVNNAALYIDDRHSLLTVDLGVMQHTMDVNVYGPLRLIQAFVPLMKKQGYGRVVNVSSGIGELSSLGPSYPAYRLSKIVLNLHTRILAGELRGTGILVNAMCPGWVRTDMGGPSAPRSAEEGADTAIWLATLPDDGPHGKFFRDRKVIPW